MDNIFDYSYYRITKLGLQSIGHWPFQSSRNKIFLRCTSFFLLSSILIPMIIKLIKSSNEFDLFVECLAVLGVLCIGVIKFFHWIIMDENMRQLLLVLKKDWQDLKYKSELQILHQYSEKARRLNITYSSTVVCLYVALVVYLSSPAVPKMLDIVKPLDEPRPNLYLYQTEYFIDQETYYVYILIHAYLTVPVGISYIIIFDNLFVTLINHACGMLEILKFRLEALHVQDITQSQMNIGVILNRLKKCFVLQTDIIKFIGKLEDSYNIALLFVVGVNILLIVFMSVLIVIKMSRPNEMIRVLFVNVGAVGHLFWISWSGHILMVKSENIFLSTYQSKWYLLPHQLQIMLIPIMMRSSKPFRITAGKLYTMSMESFGASLRTITSFMTILCSMR